MDVNYLGHIIGAWKLAGLFDGLFYAFIDGNVDFEIEPSRYAAVVLRRIKAAYHQMFIHDQGG